jgi:hypothetical protein
MLVPTISSPGLHKFIRGGQVRVVPLEALFAYSLGQQIDIGTLDLMHLTDKGQLQFRLSAPRKAD